MPIRCTPLSTIVRDEIGEFAYFDFISLDVEGAEYEVLHSLDFSNAGFGIILVECDEHNELNNLALRSFFVET